jgi:hypothetical protein
MEITVSWLIGGLLFGVAMAWAITSNEGGLKLGFLFAGLILGALSKPGALIVHSLAVPALLAGFLIVTIARVYVLTRKWQKERTTVTRRSWMDLEMIYRGFSAVGAPPEEQ